MIDRSSSLLPDITAAIGATPLVELARLSENLNGRILAKLDYLNPGSSKKDRAALQIIIDAESAGELAPGQTVVELTSGNMGTGLAIVCTIRGYPFIAVMSRGNSMERARMMKALGAEVVLVDQCPDSVPGQVSGADLQRVEEVTERLVTERQAFRADQFLLRGNQRAHYLGTGPELVAQSGGCIDGFCDFVGSGGTLAGVTQYLKEHNRAIRCYGVEPTGAEALAGGRTDNPGHRIQGGGYLKADLQALVNIELDGYLQVSDEEAIHYARELASREGVFAGYSAGANVAAAIQLLRTEMQGKTIAVIMCDSGLKYLSTDLWA